MISATPASQTQPGSLCESTEKIVFSCTVGKASKIVSLCSSKVLTKIKVTCSTASDCRERSSLNFRSNANRRSPRSNTHTTSARSLIKLRSVSPPTDTSTRSLMITTASRNLRNVTREFGSRHLAAKKPHSTVVAKQRLSTEILPRYSRNLNRFLRKLQNKEMS